MNFTTGSIKLISAMINGCFKQDERNPVPLVSVPKEKANKKRIAFAVEQQDLCLCLCYESY